MYTFAYNKNVDCQYLMNTPPISYGNNVNDNVPVDGNKIIDNNLPIDNSISFNDNLPIDGSKIIDSNLPIDRNVPSIIDNGANNTMEQDFAKRFDNPIEYQNAMGKSYGTGSVYSNNYQYQILINYFNQTYNDYTNLAGYTEENYIYATGEKSSSYYKGILTKVFGDFDNDTNWEMVVFRFVSDYEAPYSTKYIIVDVVKAINGNAVPSDTYVIDGEQYLGEEIEVDISMKRYNDRCRFYVDYFEKKVREEEYENKFIAFEYENDRINIISTLNLSGREEDNMMAFDYVDQIIDTGVNLQDDTEILKKAFLNDDLEMLPIFTIKRVNEKVRDSFVDEYFEQHRDMEDYENKLRYGYTTFINRVE